MARLKSRSKFPPGGFQFVQPQISPAVIGGHDFDSCVQAVYTMRMGNPFICQQNNLSTDKATIEAEVDEYNAARCLSTAGWEHFVADTSPPKSWTPSTSPRRRQDAGVAAGARRTVAGVRLVMEWLGDGLKPVAHELAEKRAGICVGCPKNSEPNWLQRIDAAVAAQIQSLVEIKNDLKLSTLQDEHIHTCSACDCFLKLKVHVPIEHVRTNTSEAVKAQLDPRCWVLHE